MHSQHETNPVLRVVKILEGINANSSQQLGEYLCSIYSYESEIGKNAEVYSKLFHSLLDAVKFIRTSSHPNAFEHNMNPLNLIVGFFESTSVQVTQNGARASIDQNMVVLKAIGYNLKLIEPENISGPEYLDELLDQVDALIRDVEVSNLSEDVKSYIKENFARLISDLKNFQYLGIDTIRRDHETISGLLVQLILSKRISGESDAGIIRAYWKLIEKVAVILTISGEAPHALENARQVIAGILGS